MDDQNIHLFVCYDLIKFKINKQATITATINIISLIKKRKKNHDSSELN